MDKDFLLENEVSKVLYHNYASKVPVFDYHCHLVPMEIATDHEFKNVTEMWLYHDHYKWRAMRSFGIDEEYITGNASDYDKFYQFAKMMPYLIAVPPMSILIYFFISYPHLLSYLIPSAS